MAWTLCSDHPGLSAWLVFHGSCEVPIVWRLAGAQESHAGIKSAGGYTVHRGLGWKIGAAVEPQLSVGLLSLCLILGTQERAQRRSLFVYKVYRGAFWGCRPWEEGWMSRDGEGEVSLTVSGVGL